MSETEDPEKKESIAASVSEDTEVTEPTTTEESPPPPPKPISKSKSAALQKAREARTQKCRERKQYLDRLIKEKEEVQKVNNEPDWKYKFQEMEERVNKYDKELAELKEEQAKARRDQEQTRAAARARPQLKFV